VHEGQRLLLLGSRARWGEGALRVCVCVCVCVYVRVHMRTNTGQA